MSITRPLKSEDGRRQFLINDLVVNPELCNFFCDYCLSQESPDWAMDACEIMNSDGSKKHMLEDQLYDVLEKYEESIDAHILRISGGEILLYRDIGEFLEHQSEKYETIQVLTNGYLLKEKIISKIKSLGNCHIHLSIDGHTLKLNRYRVKNQKIQDVLLDNLDKAIGEGISVEIGSVLTDTNTREYHTFLEYLLDYSGKVVVYPFPIRGDVSDKYYPSDEDVKEFAKILDNFERYETILPPRAYMEKLIELMIDRTRIFRCHLPKMAIQTFDSGVVTPCPNAWISELGNIAREEKGHLSELIDNNKIYNIFDQKRPRLPFCKSCCTSLDIISLYIEGLISDKELLKVPLYSGVKTFERIKRFRGLQMQRGK